MILTALGKGTGAGPLYPEFVGRRGTFVGNGTGPASYVPVTGDPVTLALPNYYIDALCDGVESTDGKYNLQVYPAASGTRQQWYARWFYVGNTQGVDGVSASAVGSGGTPGTYTLTASSGSATISVVIGSAGSITSITVTNPGSGYVTVPTFSNTPGSVTGVTLTATLGFFAGQEVAAGTNLSGETVQMGAFVGQF